MQTLEIMKTHVVKTSPEATLAEAVDLMDLYQVSGLPVVDGDGQLCGYLSEGDVLRAMQTDTDAEASLLGLSARTAERTVASAMTVPCRFVSESSDVREAARFLLENGLKRLPVVTDEGRVIGTLNRIDVLQAIFERTL